jgi:hypothetical protein
MRVSGDGRSYRKAFHHGAPLWRYFSAIGPAALARGGAALVAFAAAGFAGAAFLAGLALARVALALALRPRAAVVVDDFFFAERDDVLVFMPRRLTARRSDWQPKSGARAPLSARCG